MKQTLFYSMAVLQLLCLIGTGCSDDEKAGAPHSGEVSFTATVLSGGGVRSAVPVSDELEGSCHDSCILEVTVSEDWPVETSGAGTRASISNTGSLDASDDGFGLSMYSGSTLLEENLQYIYAAGNVWTAVSTAAVWPGSGTVDFYAFAPYQTARFTGAGELSGPGSETFFEVNPDNDNQIDLLLASTKGLDGNGFGAGGADAVVELEFRHILTAVRFCAGEGLSGKVERITFKGVADAGTYSTETGKWTLSGTTGDFSLEFAGNGPTVHETGVITGEEQYFFMMPQSLADSEATLELELSDATVITYRLRDSRPWDPGKVVTYTLKYADIDDSEYEFSVSNDLNMDYTGDGANSFVVTSLKDGQPQNYTIEYLVSGSVEGGDAEWKSTKPSSLNWLTSLDRLGLSSEGMETVKAAIEVAKESNVTIKPEDRNEEMATRTVLGTEAAPYDLSLVNVSTGIVADDISGRSTANCYVVQAPGWYMIPMVYGNAIKEGKTNSEVFTGAAVNHADALITRPWLSEAGVTVTSVDMLWQDARGLITEPEVISVYEENGSRQFIRFRVPVHTDRPAGYDADYVPQGNCLLAAKNASGEIVWSWHIWVTPEDLTDVSTSITNDPPHTAYHFAPVELGFCGLGEIRIDCYPAHQTQFRLTQDGSNRQLIVNVEQHMHLDKVTGNDNGYATYYQWGLKNPFPPSTGTTNACHALFAVDGTSISDPTDFGDGLEGMMYMTVLKPSKLHMVIYDGGTTWANAGLAWTASYKTINDPSPVGYRVPSKAFLTIWGGGSTKGGEEPTGGGASDIRMHYLGFRGSVSGGLGYTPYNVGTEVYYLSSEKGFVGPWTFYRYKGYAPGGDDHHAFVQGYSIRPVPEPTPVQVSPVTIAPPHEDPDQSMNF